MCEFQLFTLINNHRKTIADVSYVGIFF